MSIDDVEGLRELAHLHGVLTKFFDSAGHLHRTSADELFGILRALGVPVAGADDVAEALRSRRDELAARWIEPVAVAWDGGDASLHLRFHEGSASNRIDCTLTDEAGLGRTWSVALADLDVTGPEHEGRVIGYRLPVAGPLASGYHRLDVRVGDRAGHCLVIAAPTLTYQGPPGRTWGLFCPLYALHRASSWGAGDFSDLAALMDWTAEQGGSLVATLPMLATIFDGKPWISPYSPASRLFWNEFYLDLSALPHLGHSEAARDLMDSEEFHRDVGGLRSRSLVDYGRQMGLKRRVLELVAEAAFAAGAGEDPDLARFRRDYPEADDYARFMALGERHGLDWDHWPGGRDGGDDFDERARRYHLYVQWQSDVQLRALSERAEARGLTWYVDYTVGVDPRSFDVWRHPEAFARGASVGCPPDEGFTTGQNWGFPPSHPDRERQAGYVYTIAALRNHFRYARALRLDHVMGLHRLYWIPADRKHGGTYVTYPVEELYAILSVESERRGAWVVGENLGTVPPEVPRAMDRHGLRGLYVLQHALYGGLQAIETPPPAETVASLNTHDMPTFASYWAGTDIAHRVSLGLLNDAVAASEEAQRPEIRRDLVDALRGHGLLDPDPDAETDLASIYRACCEFLADSPSRVVVINVEDLWLETEPQNTPGTVDEVPNWRRKVRYPLEEFRQMPDVLETLRRVAERRPRPVAGEEAV